MILRSSLKLDKAYVLLYNLQYRYIDMIKTKDILPVCGVIVAVIYSWNLYRFVWILPSWLKFLTVGEIFNILSMTLAISFLDTLLVLGLLIIVALIVPFQWFRDDFVFRGCLFGLYVLIFAVYLASNVVPLNLLPVYSMGSLVVFIFLQLWGGRVLRIRSLVLVLADRAIVFLYVYLPMTLVGIVSIVLRAIW